MKRMSADGTYILAKSDLSQIFTVLKTVEAAIIHDKIIACRNRFDLCFQRMLRRPTSNICQLKKIMAVHR